MQKGTNPCKFLRAHVINEAWNKSNPGLAVRSLQVSKHPKKPTGLSFSLLWKNSTLQYHGSSHTFPMSMSMKCFVVGQIFNHTQLDSMAPSLLTQPTSPQAPPSPLRVGRPQTCQRLMKLLMLGWPNWCDRTHWVNLRENNGKPTGNHDLCSVKGFMQTLLSCSFWCLPCFRGLTGATI